MSYQQFFKKAQEAKRGEKPAAKAAPKETAEQVLRRAVRMRERKKQPVPWKALVALSASLVLTGFYFAAPEYFENLASRIEVRAMGSASAAEEKKAAEKSSTSAAGKEKAAAGEVHGEQGKSREEKEVVSEDLSHFEKLKQRKEELDLREKELTELEEELQRQKAELDKRITQLEEMRGQIAQVLKDRVEVDQEKVTKLVDLYSNMKPKQAADVIGTINEDLAVEVLAKMKKKNAAEIMNLLSPDKARALSEKYTGYRRSHPDAKG